MLRVLAHQGEPLQPHDLAGAWNLDPLLLVGLVATVVLYERGWRHADGRPRRRAFHLALLTLAVALVSPLEALAGQLISAHMVQHVLLLAIAAPLLAWSAPGAAFARGLPEAVRGWPRAVRLGAGIDAARVRRWRSPVVRWLLYVAVLWTWHASALYAAAVDHEAVHVLEHTTFVGAAFLLWSVLVGPRRIRVDRGFGVLMIFALGMQATFLSLLLTFATTPWYEPYVTTAPAWGVDALADQRLAGAVMWVPAGLVHTAIGIGLFVTWLRDVERRAVTPEDHPELAGTPTP